MSVEDGVVAYTEQHLDALDGSETDLIVAPGHVLIELRKPAGFGVMELARSSSITIPKTADRCEIAAKMLEGLRVKIGDDSKLVSHPWYRVGQTVAYSHPHGARSRATVAAVMADGRYALNTNFGSVLAYEHRIEEWTDD